MPMKDSNPLCIKSCWPLNPHTVSFSKWLFHLLSTQNKISLVLQGTWTFFSLTLKNLVLIRIICLYISVNKSTVIKMRMFSEYNIDGIFRSEMNWLYMSPCLGHRSEPKAESDCSVIHHIQKPLSYSDRNWRDRIWIRPDSWKGGWCE